MVHACYLQTYNYSLALVNALIENLKNGGYVNYSLFVLQQKWNQSKRSIGNMKPTLPS